MSYLAGKHRIVGVNKYMIQNLGLDNFLCNSECGFGGVYCWLNVCMYDDMLPN